MTKQLVRGTRGAVLAEFIIAFMPIMTIFMCMVELIHYFTMREIVYHAASATARACAVIDDPNGLQPGGAAINGPQDDARKAGEWALNPWKDNYLLTNVEVSCKNEEPKDPYGEDTGHIKATYHCVVPIAKNMVCPGGGSTKIIDVTSSFPHQGAKYKM
jgi:hypothetical protein